MNLTLNSPNIATTLWLPRAEAALQALTTHTGSGAEMTGWLTSPPQSDVAACVAAAAKRTDIDTFLVIGIGGSYLGAKAVIELLEPDNDKLIFVGNTLSGAYYRRVQQHITDKSWGIIVISKSGTTTEPALALRVFERLLRERYGADANRRVLAVTNPGGGALRSIAEGNRWDIMSIPDSIGGRYSVFTAAGLLPLACAGVNVAELVDGAYRHTLAPDDPLTLLALRYAAARQALYDSGKKTEILAVWEPNQRWLGEWYKQLFGESEGKQHLGLLPVSLEYTADLHSMGQLMQDGERTMFETFLWAAPAPEHVVIPKTEDDFDKFNHIAGRSLDDINRIALDATMAAHAEGGIPTLLLEMPTLSERSVGALLRFFMLSCAVSGYIQGVNPFDQPGVEAYKSKMKVLMRA